MIRDFLLAAQFLTALPIKIKKRPVESDFGRSILYFPVVGTILGLILGLLYYILKIPFQHIIVCASLIAFEIIITGGIHIDGFCDTVDGLCSSRKKETILEVMRDSRVGAFGVMGLIALLLIKFSALLSLPQKLFTDSLIAMTTLSRWSMVISCRFFPYAREKEGKAKQFVGNATNMHVFLTTVFIILLSVFLLGIWWSAVIIVFVVMFTIIFNSFIKKKIDGITGDTLGALNEIVEVLVILLIVLISK